MAVCGSTLDSRADTGAREAAFGSHRFFLARVSVKRICTCVYAGPVSSKSQPRTGHTREPDPSHNELRSGVLGVEMKTLPVKSIVGSPRLIKTFFRLFAGWSQSGSLRSRIYYVWVPRPPKAPNPIRDSHIDSQTFSHVFFQRFRPQNQSVLVSMLVNLLLQSFTRVLLGFRLRRSLRFFASLRSRSALL